MAPETKSCRACCSTIASKARKCPQCHAPQGYQLAIFAILIALALILQVGLVLGAVPYMKFRLNRLTRARDMATNRAGDIEIVSSRLHFVPRKGDMAHTGFAIVGQLRNKGQAAIDELRISVRVLNPDGVIIDTFRQTICERLEPGQEMPIKLSKWGDAIHAPEDQYSDHKMTVIWAFKQT